MNPIDSATLALLDLRCPRCHEGHLFSYPAYRLTKYAIMPERCPVCQVAYEPEPGFYWGAMFVSYAFSVACFAVGGVAAYYLFHDPAVWVYVLTVTAFVLLTAPATLRYSRALMLYLFGGISYNPQYARRAAAPTTSEPLSRR
ncbi:MULTISPECIES: DUF983 domain-containing protein [Hymenobacter]|nr:MULTISPECIES: DUF983 domain-containing protein [Hymenobacter]